MTQNPPAGATKRAEPESLRARSLGVSLTVKDLQKSLAWYRDVVGFTVDQEYSRDGKVTGAALKAGAVRIMLNQDDGKKGMDRIKGQGISLQFQTAQSVDDIAKRIRDSGGKLDTEPADMPWGARLFRLHDPDGFTMVISSDTRG
jgi:uncharacterized glyoxalase superfamily protein PhnB